MNAPRAHPDIALGVRHDARVVAFAGRWLFGLAAGLPFAVNAGALGMAVLLLLTLPGVFRPVPPVPGKQTRGSQLASLRRDLGEGARWLWRHPDIRPAVPHHR